MDNPFKNFTTRKVIRELHGGLFTETTMQYPRKIDGEIRYIAIGHPKYQLNQKKFSDLTKLVEARNGFHGKQNYFFEKMQKDPNNPNWKKEFQEAGEEVGEIQKKLKEEYQYHLLFCLPQKIGRVYPFFDMRYVTQQTDLKTWAKIIKLELKNHYIFAGSSRGKPAKDDIYIPEVFESFEKYRDYAKLNKTKPEIDKNPDHWASEKTMEEFPSLKIRASHLIKLAKKERQKKA
jgi:hypothetical protein